MFEKGISKKIVLGFWRFFKYAFFEYLEKGISKKNCARFFKIL